MSLEVTFKNMKILPKLFDSESKKKDDTFSFTISPIQTITDSSINPPKQSKDSLVGGARRKARHTKKTVRPKLRNKFSDYDYYDDEFFGGEEESFATAQLKRDVMNLKNKKTANEIVLDRLYLSSERKIANDESTINIDSSVTEDKPKIVPKNEGKRPRVEDVSETATEALVNRLEKVAVNTPKTEESTATPTIEEPNDKEIKTGTNTETSNTVQKFNEHANQLAQKGGVIGLPDFFDDEVKEEDDEEEEEFEQSGGDFNTFISSLYNKKVGGKKRQYSEKATEFNRQTTEIIKSVYPNINPEELRAVRSEIYQTIRAKYDPEVFKTLKDYEKSELLFKATTPEVVKKINIKKAVENKRKRIEEYFGKKKEETPSNPEDDVKETKKAKKTKKTKRGGAIEYDEEDRLDDDETVELPYVLNGGNCSCMTGGCDKGGNFF